MGLGRLSVSGIIIFIPHISETPNPRMRTALTRLERSIETAIASYQRRPCIRDVPLSADEAAAADGALPLLYGQARVISRMMTDSPAHDWLAAFQIIDDDTALLGQRLDVREDDAAVSLFPVFLLFYDALDLAARRSDPRVLDLSVIATPSWPDLAQTFAFNDWVPTTPAASI